mmetsp:Transcript_3599/g.6902  ORF Transcript_3599/g.6902 Transcript_3599/m.6902 type:complete len:472 (-) Transcript_3599:18-1433(-)
MGAGASTGLWNLPLNEISKHGLVLGDAWGFPWKRAKMLSEVKSCLESPLKAMKRPVQLTVSRMENESALDTADALSKIDPYVRFYVRGQEEAAVKTKTVSNNDNPVWDNEKLLLPMAMLGDVVQVQLFDADTFTADDLIAECEFELDMDYSDYELRLHMDGYNLFLKYAFGPNMRSLNNAESFDDMMGACELTLDWMVKTHADAHSLSDKIKRKLLDLSQDFDVALPELAKSLSIPPESLGKFDSLDVEKIPKRLRALETRVLKGVFKCLPGQQVHVNLLTKRLRISLDGQDPKTWQPVLTIDFKQLGSEQPSRVQEGGYYEDSFQFKNGDLMYTFKSPTSACLDIAVSDLSEACFALGLVGVLRSSGDENIPLGGAEAPSIKFPVEKNTFEVAVPLALATGPTDEDQTNGRLQSLCQVGLPGWDSTNPTCCFRLCCEYVDKLKASENGKQEAEDMVQSFRAILLDEDDSS